MPEQSSHAPDPLFVGDNLALDFINTRYGVGHARRECFVDDASVVDWLKRAGVAPDDYVGTPTGLLNVALALRENAQSLLNAARLEEGADAVVVNRVLEDGRAIREVRWDSAGKSFRVVMQRRLDTAASLLEPVAQALVTLLTDTNLRLVRQCEAHDCTLLFHDLTKSHRRRWCSMAACGNRMKVAAYRSRHKA